MVFAFSCAYKSIKHGEEITEEQVTKIIDGKTTKQEIFIEFGNPSKTMDNEKVFFYSWTRGSKSSFMGLGGGSAYTHSLVIVFDDNGIVKNHKITRGATEGAVSVHD
jgi:outer membrane protein assembly factor BamE (lipoprotein component of BamABCDE complex)